MMKPGVCLLYTSYLLAHKPEVLEELTAQIASGTFRVKDYREREIVEGGKLRRIQVIPMKDVYKRQDMYIAQVEGD